LGPKSYAAVTALLTSSNVEEAALSIFCGASRYVAAAAEEPPVKVDGVDSGT
jgi:hypothetical protein